MLRNICIIAAHLIKLGFAKKQNAVHSSHVQRREQAIIFLRGHFQNLYVSSRGF